MSIKVVVRVRPFNLNEFKRNSKCIITMEGFTTCMLYFFYFPLT